MPERRQPLPARRGETTRQAILRHLEQGPLTALELSGLVHVRERDVIPHLEHLARSLRRSGLRLVVEPAACRSCGYVFRSRTRLDKPGSCPGCRERRIDPPVYRVESD